jgi:hypothetical protein
MEWHHHLNGMAPPSQWNGSERAVKRQHRFILYIQKVFGIFAYTAVTFHSNQMNHSALSSDSRGDGNRKK